jgi:hypothetical protein
VRDGLLWRLPPYENPPAVDIFVVVNPQTQLNRAEQEFRRLFDEQIGKTPLAERTYGPSSWRKPAGAPPSRARAEGAVK